MNEPCAQCGSLCCEETFHRFLAREYVEAGYGAVHHLTVAAYMLQHPQQLSEEGWRAMRDTLRAFLLEGRSAQEHRALIREHVSSDNRSWSLKNGPRLALPAGFRWTQTIDAVDDAAPARYCRDIEDWARAVLQDAETI